MSLPTISIKDKQQSDQLEVKRMAIYQQCKIIEACDVENQTYYIFFHNNIYLNYVISKNNTKPKYMKSALQKGLTVSAPHPLIDTILSSYSHFKRNKFNDLFNKLQQQYSMQETALIATYFTPFIKKEKLAHYIQTLFYKERRDGKLLTCYRILQVLKDFSPKHKLLQAFSGDLDFTRYDELYKNGDERTLAKDPIYVEKNLFGSKYEESSFHQLIDLYTNQSRWIDLIAIHLARVTSTHSVTDYQKALSLINEHLTNANRLDILNDLYDRGLEIEPLLQDLIESLIDHKQIVDLLTLISKHELNIQPSQSEALTKIVKQKEVSMETVPPKGWQTLLLALFEANDPQAPDLFYQAITALLTNHDVSFLQKWVEPLRDYHQATPLIEKIDAMNSIVEDPNQQRRLGELYYYFDQTHRAIECMSWDMELYVEDPQPVQWLAKLYQETGREEEHLAYKQLYIDMVKRA